MSKKIKDEELYKGITMVRNFIMENDIYRYEVEIFCDDVVIKKYDKRNGELIKETQCCPPYMYKFAEVSLGLLSDNYPTKYVKEVSTEFSDDFTLYHNKATLRSFANDTTITLPYKEETQDEVVELVFENKEFIKEFMNVLMSNIENSDTD